MPALPIVNVPRPPVKLAPVKVLRVGLPVPPAFPKTRPARVLLPNRVNAAALLFRVTMLPGAIAPAAFVMTVALLMTKPLLGSVASGMVPVAATLSVP